MVADAKDAQRVDNYMISEQVRAIGIGARAPYTLDPRQIEGLESWWDAANIDNNAYLPARRWIKVGDQWVDAGWPHRNVDEPAIQAISQAMRDAKQNIKSTTGRHGTNLGEPSQERSGKAIRERRAQGELSSSHFLDILSTVAIPYEMMVINDLMFEVYDTPGRNAMLTGDTESDEREVMLNQPFTQGPDGQPQAVDPAMPPPPDVEVEEFTLTKDGEYLTTCSVGKSTKDQKEENAFLFSEIIQAAPQLINQLADLWVGSLEGPAADEAAKRLKPGAQQIPPEVQQQMQQIQEQNQKLQQMVQQFQIKDAGKQQQAQADIFMKREDIASRERIAANALKADFAKVRATLEGKAQTEETKAEIAALDREQEKFEAEAQRRHDKAMLELKADLDAMLESQKADDAERLAQTHAFHADRMDDKQGARAERLDERTGARQDRSERRKIVSDHVLTDRKGRQALETTRAKAALAPKKLGA